MLEIRTLGSWVKIEYRHIRISILQICANKVFLRYLEGLIMIDIIFNNKAQSEKKIFKKKEKI